MNPLDNTVYFADDRLILKLTQDSMVTIVTGIPMHCRSQTTAQNNDSLIIGPITSLTFNSQGQLYFSENAGKKISYIKIVESNGNVKPFSGRTDDCRCLSNWCECRDQAKSRLAESVKLSSVSAVTMSPSDTLFVADQGSLRILHMKPYFPKALPNGDYQIPNPETNEIYVFNRYGQHVNTRDMRTGRIIYSFMYNINTSTGKLSHVQDSSGNKISFLRDSRNQVNTVENSLGRKYKLVMSRKGLESFEVGNNLTIKLEYKFDSGLLVSRSDSTGGTFIYQYDNQGRIMKQICETGQTYTYTSDLSENGFNINIKKNDQPYVKVDLEKYPQEISYKTGKYTKDI